MMIDPASHQYSTSSTWKALWLLCLYVKYCCHPEWWTQWVLMYFSESEHKMLLFTKTNVKIPLMRWSISGGRPHTALSHCSHSSGSEKYEDLVCSLASLIFVSHYQVCQLWTVSGVFIPPSWHQISFLWELQSPEPGHVTVEHTGSREGRESRRGKGLLLIDRKMERKWDCSFGP